MSDDDYNDSMDEQFFNKTPENSLDLNMRLIDPAWGSNEVPKKLRDELSKFSFARDNKGSLLRDDSGRLIVSNEGSLWELLGFYTRDMRLSNLDDKMLAKCEHYINLANDYLKMKFFSAFLVSLSRAVTILELRQSHRGFLRRRQNTMTMERFSSDKSAPEKKGLFNALGGKKR